MAKFDYAGWTERIWRKFVANSNDTIDHFRSTDFVQEVARGNVPGAKIFGAFGERLAAGGEVNHVVRPNGEFTIPPEGGIQMAVVSTSDNDTDGGTNINTVEIHYLDGDLLPNSETVTLNGTTPVLTDATDIRFVQCTHVNSFGSVPEADGDITVENPETGGSIHSQISAGELRCTSSARMVPGNKRLYVAGASAGASSGTSEARVKVRIASTEVQSPFTSDAHTFVYPFALVPFGTIAEQDSSTTYNFPVPFSVSPGQVVAMTETTNKDATIAASWHGWIEDET